VVLSLSNRASQRWLVHRTLTRWQDGNVDVRPAEGVEQRRHRLADDHQLLEVRGVDKNLEAKKFLEPFFEVIPFLACSISYSHTPINKVILHAIDSLTSITQISSNGLPSKYCIQHDELHWQQSENI